MLLDGNVKLCNPVLIFIKNSSESEPVVLELVSNWYSTVRRSVLSDNCAKKYSGVWSLDTQSISSTPLELRVKAQKCPTRNTTGHLK